MKRNLFTLAFLLLLLRFWESSSKEELILTALPFVTTVNQILKRERLRKVAISKPRLLLRLIHIDGYLPS